MLHIHCRQEACQYEACPKTQQSHRRLNYQGTAVNKSRSSEWKWAKFWMESPNSGEHCTASLTELHIHCITHCAMYTYTAALHCATYTLQHSLCYTYTAALTVLHIHCSTPLCYIYTAALTVLHIHCMQHSTVLHIHCRQEAC